MSWQRKSTLHFFKPYFRLDFGRKNSSKISFLKISRKFLLASQSDAHTIAPHRDPIHTHPIHLQLQSEKWTDRARSKCRCKIHNTKLRIYEQSVQKKLLQDNEKVQKLYKKRCETSALNTNQELPQYTTIFNQKIQSSTQKGPMNSAIQRQLLET